MPKPVGSIGDRKSALIQTAELPVGDIPGLWTGLGLAKWRFGGGQMDDVPKKRLKVAIIGTGISGMSAAWLISQRHSVTIYERDERLGGHSHTVDAPNGNTTIPVDTGFIVYNEKTYPNLTALFAHLDVATEPSEMSFAVSLDNGGWNIRAQDLACLPRNATCSVRASGRCSTTFTASIAKPQPMRCCLTICIQRSATI